MGGRGRLAGIAFGRWVRIGLTALAVLLFVTLAVIAFGSGDEGQTGAEPTAERLGPAPCTTTIGPEDRLATELAKAQAGEVICLRGDHWAGARIPAAATDKHGYVTVRAASGSTPTFEGELTFEGARHLRFEGLAFRAGLSFTPSAEAVEIRHNDISGTGGIYFFGDPEQGGSSSDVLIAENHIHDIDYSGPQDSFQGYGIKSVGAQHGFTVEGNTIASVAADYIQTDVADDWTVTGNTFLGPTLVGGHPQEHQDLWQIYAGGRHITFSDNVARDTGTGESLLFQLTYPADRFADVTVENNLFDHDSSGFSVQIYQAEGLVFRHNTVVGSTFGAVFRRDDRFPAGSGYTVEGNVFAETAKGADFGFEEGVQSWGTFDRNVTSDDSAIGPGSVRNWRPDWGNTVDYQPVGLPIAAGFSPTG